MQKFLLIISLLLLFVTEFLRVYFIMPFPGSQQADTVYLAYFLHQYQLYIRFLCLLIIGWVVFRNFRRWKKGRKIFIISLLLVYVLLFYLVSFRFLADKMFYQPENKLLSDVSTNKIPEEKLVIGVVINNEARAYPVEIIGYHHQVQDTIGGEPVMITYCTVCRSGRVFSPVIEGSKESFRLVGMDHFNAMFEDKTTGSWWRQISGEAITGPRKGYQLREILSEQMTLAAWIRSHPAALILQPDSVFSKQYSKLEGFDKGTVKSGFEKRDSGSWKNKSWVIGVDLNGKSRAYDWNDLVADRIIQDDFNGRYILLILEPDSTSFHVYNSEVNGRNLIFQFRDQSLTDTLTGSVWNMDGICMDGTFKNSRLEKVQASQEFWHSWKTFHPATDRYNRLLE